MSRHVLAVCFLFLGIAVVSAVPSKTGPDTEELPRTVETARERVKRRPGWFRRAAKPTPAEQLAFAKDLEQRSSLRRAARAYDALVHTWPDSPEAVEAQQALGAVLERRGKIERAFKEYQYLIKHYAGLFPYDEVLARQFELAERAKRTRYGRIAGLGGFAAPERAIPLFETVAANAPASPLAPQALIETARIHLANKDYEEAYTVCERIQSRFPDHPIAAEAAFLGAESLYRLARAYRNDTHTAEAARSAFVQFLRRHPSHPQAEKARQYTRELDERLANALLEQARYYDRVVRQPAAALPAYHGILERYPATQAAAEARLRLQRLAPNTGASHATE